MKRCPSCNRTYADETLSFCLADGALLSAPYDHSRDEAPPTEIMPATAPPPTQPVKAAIPTITSIPGPRGFEHQPPARQRSNFGLIMLLLSGLAVLAIVVAIVVWAFVSYTQRGADQGGLMELTTPTPTPGYSPSSTPSAFTSPFGTPTPGARNTPQSTPTPSLNADPMLFPPANSYSPYATPTPSRTPAVDYNRVFTAREVDSKAVILSRPQPGYTEEARKNQITGVVVLSVVLAANGSVTNIQVVSGLPYGLSEKAIAAARNITFTPAMKDGRSVSTPLKIQYNFNLY